MRPSPPSAAGGVAPAAPLATLLVVVVDATNRDLLSRRLRQQGYAVCLAADGAEALGVLATQPCDAVLLDVMMPGQSGLDVLAAIRRDASTRHLPVIMVTSKSETRDIVEALDLGANDCVTTPIDFPVTLARVRAQLGRATAERAALTDQRHQDLQHAQKLSAVGRLTTGAAHDVNNLLTTIHAYGEFLRDDLPDGDERRTYAGQILRAADSAAGLSRQLLAYSRRPSTGLPSVDLGASTRAMVCLLDRVLGDDIVIAADVAGDVWPVMGDAGQLDQVLLNLIVNAADAMPGGGRIDVAVANVCAADGGRPGVELTVTDTGCGIDADTVPRIFEPFFTTKVAGHGTGLGLAMVRAIIEHAGGTVAVESRPGQGTTFRVRLPRAAAPVTTAAGDGGTAASPAGARVLVVEDDDAVRDVTRRTLMRLGHAVVAAASGDDALALILERPAPFDVLVTDVSMPGMDGVALWRALRRICPEMAVVFMSAHGGDTVADARQTGQPLLQKPFSSEALRRAVERALDAELAPPSPPAAPGPPARR
ncbi:MAG: response regulator [Vicinamibacterales bacterium]